MIKPYNLGVLLAEFAKPHCQLCHCRPSSLVAIDSIHVVKQSLSSFGRLNSGALCIECHHSLAWLPKPKKVELDFSSGLSQIINIQPATYYQYPINKVIQGFKFSEDMRMLPILVHIIRQIPRPIGCHSQNSVIIPVPTTLDRLSSRGFNPLSILTPYLSAHWDIPIWNGVKRIDNRGSQRRLSRIERGNNVKGAFVLTDNIPVDKAMIFDDVATTGSTIKELATVLYLKSNSIDVKAYCIAHGNAEF